MSYIITYYITLLLTTHYIIIIAYERAVGCKNIV